MKTTHCRGFIAIWQYLGIFGRFGSEEFSRLSEQYSHPPRAYHNLGHIEQCLDEFIRSSRLAVNPYEVELAIWYHDVVYDSRAKDNEEQSALFAKKSLERASPIHDKIGERVSGLILATKHLHLPTDNDAKLVVDIDLSILGQSEERFDEYERQIREEYSWVPDDDFARGRSLVLESFLQRPRIYSTDFFADVYELKARKNLIRSIANLKGQNV